MNWRQQMYDWIYRRGAARWETGSMSVPAEVEELIEAAHALPASRALDLGCGTGSMAIYLAQHGWQVVGVDFSPAAIQAARAKANGIAGVTFVEGDVTQLADVGVQGPFDLALDIGCFHGLPANRRQAYVREVARVTRPGALLLIWAYSGNRRFKIPGAPYMTKTEIRDRFGTDFTVDVTEKQGAAAGGRWEATLYVLHRR
jgi:SAM-dependent methyltransferase